MTTDLADHGSVSVEPELRLHSASAFYEQLDSRLLGQRSQLEVVFGREVEALTTRCDNLKRRGGAEKLAQHRSFVEHMLEGVDHQKQLLVGQVFPESILERLSTGLLDPENLRDRCCDESGICEWREVDQEHAVRELRQQLARK